MNRFSIRVYYEDTDAGGVVYYANYFKYAERARTEVLRAAGIEQFGLYAEAGIAFVVKNVEAEFHRPARLDDLLTVHTQVLELGGASLRMQQRILRGDELLITMQVRIGVVGRDFKPARLPVAVREKLG